MINFSLRQMDAFLAVASTLNFNKAAEICHLSQPALSANIKRLEESIGARLFDRHTRKVALTPVGREFLRAAKTVNENVEQAFSQVRHFVAGTRGRLAITASPSIAASFVPKVIAKMKAELPGLEMVMRDELSDLSVELVRQGTFDVALVPLQDDALDLIQCPLFDDHIAVVIPVDHPLTKKKVVSWSDLRKYEHITVNQSSSIRHLVDSQLKRGDAPLKPNFEISRINTMMGLILAGLGIGVLPESYFYNLKVEGITFRRIQGRNSFRTICAAYSNIQSGPPTLAPFLALCQEAAKQVQLERGRRA